MRLRILTGAFAGVLITLLIYKGPVVAMLAVIFIAIIWAYSELDRLLFPTPSPVRRFRLWVAIPLACLAFAQNEAVGWIYSWFLFTLFALFHLAVSSQTQDLKKVVRDFSLEWMAYFYLVSLFAFLVPIGKVGRDYLFHLFFFVFMGDTGAYFIGSKWGKHKLAPKLSPKKSIEGAIGGLLASLGASAAWYFVIMGKRVEDSYFVKIMIFTVIGAIAAQLGDLFESVIKRSGSAKDSGLFLPGHGGILDRIDSLAFVAPLYYFFVRIFLVSG